MDGEYNAEIFQSVTEIDITEWTRIIDIEQDIAMDPGLIHLLETTLPDQARFWTIIIRNQHKQIAACACLCLFSTDIVRASNPILQIFVKMIRSVWKNALKQNVLFCGLPMPAGYTHVRIDPQEKIDSVLSLLNKTMADLARSENAQLLVFKEMDIHQDRELNYLKNLGYVRGELEPVYYFKRSFKNFKDYESALRSTYRYQIHSNIKKFKNASLTVEHIHDSEEIFARFTDQVHRLYLNVWERAKEKLECFPADFFRNLAREFPNRVALTLISDNQQPVAFTIGIRTEKIYHNLYAGLDYNYLDRVDLYFNLFYHELENVFALDVKKIYLGQTSGLFKSRLGASPDPRFFWVKPLNPAMGMVFKLCQKWIFPKVQCLEKQVFKSNLREELV